LRREEDVGPGALSPGLGRDAEEFVVEAQGVDLSFPSGDVEAGGDAGHLGLLLLLHRGVARGNEGGERRSGLVLERIWKDREGGQLAEQILGDLELLAQGVAHHRGDRGSEERGELGAFSVLAGQVKGGGEDAADPGVEVGVGDGTVRVGLDEDTSSGQLFLQQGGEVIEGLGDGGCEVLGLRACQIGPVLSSDQPATTACISRD
jgi:hypothetical protein